MCSKITITLPKWVEEFLKKNKIEKIEKEEDRMRFVIELSRLNVQHGTGGPFAAAVFDTETHQLISIGLNRVIPSHYSIAHAEIVAILMAEEKIKDYDLGARNRFELITSSQPCIQCYGALFWSGIAKVVIGARREDVEKLAGFDEGPLPEDWAEQLERKGIVVERDVLREEADKVLEEYSRSGGIIYNSSIKK